MISGAANTGRDNSGHGNSGNGNAGNRNSGNGNAGGWNTGNRNSGNGNAGGWNAGNRNSGNGNAGGWNAGNCNDGNCNVGNGNVGRYNTGNYNTGNWNTGDWNACDCSSGFFMTKRISFEVFNKVLTPEEFGVFVQSEGYKICERFTLLKRGARRQTGLRGDFRYAGYKTSWRYFWNNLTFKERVAVRRTPHFDKDVFFEITGVKA